MAAIEGNENTTTELDTRSRLTTVSSTTIEQRPYFLNRDKAISKKLKPVCPSYVLKDRGQCAIFVLNVSDFELFCYNSSKFYTELNSTCVECRDQQDATPETKYAIFDSTSDAVAGSKKVTMTLYRTINKIMVQGRASSVRWWLDVHFPCLIVEVVSSAARPLSPLPSSCAVSIPFHTPSRPHCNRPLNLLDFNTSAFTPCVTMPSPVLRGPVPHSVQSSLPATDHPPSPSFSAARSSPSLYCDNTTQMSPPSADVSHQKSSSSSISVGTQQFPISTDASSQTLPSSPPSPVYPAAVQRIDASSQTSPLPCDILCKLNDLSTAVQRIEAAISPSFNFQPSYPPPPYPQPPCAPPPGFPHTWPYFCFPLPIGYPPFFNPLGFQPLVGHPPAGGPQVGSLPVPSVSPQSLNGHQPAVPLPSVPPPVGPMSCVHPHVVSPPVVNSSVCPPSAGSASGRPSYAGSLSSGPKSVGPPSFGTQCAGLSHDAPTHQVSSHVGQRPADPSSTDFRPDDPSPAVPTQVGPPYFGPPSVGTLPQYASSVGPQSISRPPVRPISVCGSQAVSFPIGRSHDVISSVRRSSVDPPPVNPLSVGTARVDHPVKRRSVLLVGSSVIKKATREMLPGQAYIKTLGVKTIAGALDYINFISSQHFDFDFICFQIGSNDLVFSTPEVVETQFRNLLTITRRLWPHATIIISGILPRFIVSRSFPERRNDLNRRLRSLAGGVGAFFVGQFLDRGFLDCDGIHPTFEGTQVFIKRLSDCIVRLRSSGKTS